MYIGYWLSLSANKKIGIIGSYRYRPIWKKAYRSYTEAIDFFFDIFLKDVPTENCSFGQLSPNKHPAIVEIVEDVIRDGVSLMAVDCANGKLAGIRLSYTITR